LVVKLPNQNVLFEFGFFYGRFKRKRVAAIKYGSVHLPSDLGGYVHISGRRSFSENQAKSVSKKTKKDFERWLVAGEFHAEEDA
jgi:predicted nucleotide-binding protein